MSSVVNRLIEVRDRLRVARETINTSLHDAEKRLVGLGLGVMASVPLDDTHALWFKRHGEWRFVIVDDKDCEQPLDNATMARRRAAALKLPALMLALIEAAEAEEASILGTIDQIDRFEDLALLSEGEK